MFKDTEKLKNLPITEFNFMIRCLELMFSKRKKPRRAFNNLVLAIGDSRIEYLNNFIRGFRARLKEFPDIRLRGILLGNEELHLPELTRPEVLSMLTEIAGFIQMELESREDSSIEDFVQSDDDNNNLVES